MRKPLVAGNWKMHLTLSEARELVAGIRVGLEKIKNVEVLISPPFTLLFPMAKAVAGYPLGLGAQNLHEKLKGAFTGEISALMLKDTGCTYVIAGHSERRQHFGETGDRLAKKVRTAQSNGLNVIFCVGETLFQREQGETPAVVTRQMGEVLGSDVDPNKLVMAYEPVWAIGTGHNATPQQAQEVHGLIRGELRTRFGQNGADSVRILYGGSVKPDNARALADQPEIDGMLVGGASLVAADFLAIIEAVSTSRAGDHAVNRRL